MPSSSYFFFTATATTEIYTLSLHDALPICVRPENSRQHHKSRRDETRFRLNASAKTPCNRYQGQSRFPGNDYKARSEEHTSELQSPYDLVCRLLLEKKKKDHQLTPTKK